MSFIAVYRRVLILLASEKKVILVLVAANAIVAGLQFLDPVLFGRVIGLLAGSNEMASDDLWSQAASLLGLWAAVGAAGIIANMAMVVQAERLAHRNRLSAMSRYFAHVLELPLSFHGDAHSGRLMKGMITGADSLFAAWLLLFREQLSTFICTLVLMPITLLMNWKLSIVLIGLVVLFCIFAILVIRKTETAQRRVEQYHSNLAGTAQDALANVMVVQSFTRLSLESRRFGEIVQELIANQFPVLNWWAIVNVLTRAASTVTVIIMVIIGTVLHVHGEASVAEIVSFMGIANLLIGRLESAMNFVSRLFFMQPGLEEFFHVMDARSSVPEQANAPALTVSKGEVSFENVSFAYPNGPRILDGVSFHAAAGTSVALVGHTGAGKSTSMNLLQRLWDPVEGSIVVDGQNIHDVSLESLRHAIGVVFQESLLFNRSIRENLLIGRPDASEEDIERACHLADAHEFITRQPQGYDTLVGERGATLSGGQRQRLAIARALLKDPPILILDEATSALDAATEARVSRAMANLMRGRTTFIIAHRLSTVKDADEILVFDGGRIVERGRFEALVQRQGRFADLVSTQLTHTPALQAAE